MNPKSRTLNTLSPRCSKIFIWIRILQEAKGKKTKHEKFKVLTQTQLNFSHEPSEPSSVIWLGLSHQTFAKQPEQRQELTSVKGLKFTVRFLAKG